MSMFDALPAAAVPVTAGVTSFAATLSLAAGAAPVPAEVPAYLPYLTTIIGPVLLFLLGRGAKAFAAYRHGLAKSQRERAARLRADNDPTNDAQADALEDKAAGNDALANAVEAIKGSKGE